MQDNCEKTIGGDLTFLAVFLSTLIFLIRTCDRVIIITAKIGPKKSGSEKGCFIVIILAYDSTSGVNCFLEMPETETNEHSDGPLLLDLFR